MTATKLDELLTELEKQEKLIKSIQRGVNKGKKYNMDVIKKKSELINARIQTQ